MYSLDNHAVFPFPYSDWSLCISSTNNGLLQFKDLSLNTSGLPDFPKRLLIYLFIQKRLLIFINQKQDPVYGNFSEIPSYCSVCFFSPLVPWGVSKIGRLWRKTQLYECTLYYGESTCRCFLGFPQYLPCMDFRRIKGNLLTISLPIQ